MGKRLHAESVIQNNKNKLKTKDLFALLSISPKTPPKLPHTSTPLKYMHRRHPKVLKYTVVQGYCRSICGSVCVEIR